MSKEQINIFQLRAIIITATIGIGIINLPRSISMEAGTTSWLAVLLGTVFILFAALLILKLLKYFPNHDIYEISCMITGVYFGKIIALLYVAYFVLVVSSTSRFTTGTVNIWMLPLTPTKVLLVVFIGIVVFLSFHNIEVLARFSSILLPAVVGSLILIISSALPFIKLYNIQPIFYIDPLHLAKGVQKSFLSLFGVEMLFIFYKYVAEKKQVKQNTLLSISFIGILYVALTTVTIGYFGKEQLKLLVYPIVSLFKSIAIPYLIVERAELIFLLLWLSAAITTVGIYFFSSCYLLTKIFPQLNKGLIIAFVFGVSFYIAQAPSNIDENFKVLEFTGNVGLVPVLFIPILLLIVGKLRGVLK
ncbi:spore germination protein [Anaerosolibacter carboniphilus]|uniref:Spore germination protein n=1 Tax=Anaerosolibacter carboniphilus TaxID=1417629 RepID=A0A841L987_9FIRM|nr:endospore germination permease [Anaerosolibacter carboniphilus]MBB6218815.1 spore germination protein [Anaerosolibacter carboniphilus]